MSKSEQTVLFIRQQLIIPFFPILMIEYKKMNDVHGHIVCKWKHDVIYVKMSRLLTIYLHIKNILFLFCLQK